MLYSKFKGGPDWVKERSLAEAALDGWKEGILESLSPYKDKHAKWKVKIDRIWAKWHKENPSVAVEPTKKISHHFPMCVPASCCDYYSYLMLSQFKGSYYVSHSPKASCRTNPTKTSYYCRCHGKELCWLICWLWPTYYQ